VIGIVSLLKKMAGLQEINSKMIVPTASNNQSSLHSFSKKWAL
jgi:hypothetical protein